MALGVLISIITTYAQRESFDLYFNGTYTKGTIVSRSKTPVFVFQDADGKEHEVESVLKRVQSKSRRRKTAVYTVNTGYEKGESIEVVYDPGNPKRARIVSFIELWGLISLGNFVALLSVVHGSNFYRGKKLFSYRKRSN